MRAIWRAAVAAVTGLLLVAQTPASAAEPIKVGLSMAMTGGVAQNGKQLLLALQLWRDDVNAKGGLLGRPVELVYLRRSEQSIERAGYLQQAHQRRQSRFAARAVRHQYGRGGDAGYR